MSNANSMSAGGGSLLQEQDFAVLRRAALRHPIALQLDDLAGLKPSDRCKLAAVALVKTGDRALIEEARASGFFDRVRLTAIGRKESEDLMVSGNLEARPEALERLKSQV